jgi:molybdenum cofactor cytidylyltransferase
VLDATLGSKLDRVVLVLGHNHQAIQRILARSSNNSQLHIVLNNNYPKGQSSSLHAGLKEIQDEFPAVMFLLGDQPMVDSKTIDCLLDQFQHSEKEICVPTYHEKRGNPVIFSSRFYDQILDIKGDKGAREIIRMHPKMILKVEIDNPLCFFDIDTLEDLAKLDKLIA